MFDRPFHELIQWRRRSLNLKQVDLATELGLPAHRLSKLERGVLRPTEVERALLVRRLDLGFNSSWEFRPPRAIRNLLDTGRKNLPNCSPYFPPSDRPSRVRLMSATRKWPDLVFELIQQIRRREDYDMVAFFCGKLALDSCDECLYLLYRLAQGATPGLVPPGTLGHLTHPIVCPASSELVGHRPMPCLIQDGRFEFWQVSLLTQRLYTLDILSFQGDWKCIEIDGLGHDSRGDAERTAAIGLPTTRLSAEQVHALAKELIPRRAS